MRVKLGLGHYCTSAWLSMIIGCSVTLPSDVGADGADNAMSVRKLQLLLLTEVYIASAVRGAKAV